MNESHQALLTRHLEAENRHDLDATLATLHPECLFEDRALDLRLDGREGAARYYRLWWDALGVVVERPEDGASYWAADGTYIAEAAYRGTHAGPFLGIASTGREIVLRFTVIIGFRDGLMAGERFYYDLAGLLRQMGADRLPDAAAMAAAA